MTDEHIIAYLLKELSEEESEQFEDECFQQERWPEHISLVEEELINAYLRDELKPEQRQRFTANYLITTARRERVNMAAALLRHVDEYHDSQVTITKKKDEKTWAEWLRALWSSQMRPLHAVVAFAVVVVIVGALWISRPRTYATLTLMPRISNRAEGVMADKVKLPTGVDALRIQLMLPERSAQAVRYRVELEDEDGASKPLETTAQDAQSVTVVIPSGQLARRLYTLKLIATTSDSNEQRIDANYFFAVE